MLYTRVPLKVCRIEWFRKFGDYEERKGKKGRTERRRKERQRKEEE